MKPQIYKKNRLFSIPIELKNALFIQKVSNKTKMIKRLKAVPLYEKCKTKAYLLFLVSYF